MWICTSTGSIYFCGLSRDSFAFVSTLAEHLSIIIFISYIYEVSEDSGWFIDKDLLLYSVGSQLEYRIHFKMYLFSGFPGLSRRS